MYCLFSWPHLYIFMHTISGFVHIITWFFYSIQSVGNTFICSCIILLFTKSQFSNYYIFFSSVLLNGLFPDFFNGEEVDSNLNRFTGFFPTRRGGRTLVLNGYHYRVDKNYNNRTAWKCKRQGCMARCITDMDGNIIKVSML